MTAPNSCKKADETEESDLTPPALGDLQEIRWVLKDTIGEGAATGQK